MISIIASPICFSFQAGYRDIKAGYRDDGLRAWKDVSNGYNIRRYFLYDGTHVVYEVGTGTDVTAYGYGANGLVQRWLKSAGYPTGSYTAYMFNPMGSVVSRVPQNYVYPNPVEDIAVYSAFGSLRLYDDPNYVEQTAPPDPVGYGGQWGNYTDVESGLVLNAQDAANSLMTLHFDISVRVIWTTHRPVCSRTTLTTVSPADFLQYDFNNRC